MTTKKSEIIIALHEIMKKVGYVQKKGRNDFHKYNYAGEADLLEALRPAMIEHGLLLIPSGQNISEIDSNGNTHVAIDYTLAHTSGEVWPEKIRAFGCGNDRAKNGNVGDKGTYKALTGANKYLLFKLFQIETGDDPEKDNGGHDAEPRHQPDKKTMSKAPPAKEGGVISPSNVEMLERIAKRAGLTVTELDSYVKENFKINTRQEVPLDQFTEIMSDLKKLQPVDTPPF